MLTNQLFTFHTQAQPRQQTSTRMHTDSHIDTLYPIKKPSLIKGIISAIIRLYVCGAAILFCELKYNH